MSGDQKIPTGPQRNEPATDGQMDFIAKIAKSPGVDMRDLSGNPTKGEASDAIAEGLEAAKRASPREGSGAAEDTTPGDKKPSGPSAKQPATGNQKEFANRLAGSGNVGSPPKDATKGEMSDFISSALDATKSGSNSSGKAGGQSGSGAAPDNDPGSVKPTGPSAQQDATRNQKTYAQQLGAEVPQGATKGEASDIIEDAQQSKQ